MSLSRDFGLAALWVALVGVMPACNSQGRSGEACEADASALYPDYSCNAGLVCNTGESTPTCEAPNTQGLDGPCGDNDNCKSNLYCAVTRTCEAQLSVGEPCPDETGCEPGLVCFGAPTPMCVEADSGYGLPGDAAAPDAAATDAATTDATTDATSDAAPADATEATDAVATVDGGCGAAGDGGEQTGFCPSGGQCCPGGAFGTYYCYTGESGTCPALP